MHLYLTLKAPSKIAADNAFIFFFKKIRLDVSCESSAKQRIHMKYQALFFQKNNKKYSRLSSAAVLIGPLKVKALVTNWTTFHSFCRLVSKRT